MGGRHDRMGPLTLSMVATSSRMMVETCRKMIPPSTNMVALWRTAERRGCASLFHFRARACVTLFHSGEHPSGAQVPTTKEESMGGRKWWGQLQVQTRPSTLFERRTSGFRHVTHVRLLFSRTWGIWRALNRKKWHFRSTLGGFFLFFFGCTRALYECYRQKDARPCLVLDHFQRITNILLSARAQYTHAHVL